MSITIFPLPADQASLNPGKGMSAKKADSQSSASNGILDDFQNIFASINKPSGGADDSGVATASDPTLKSVNRLGVLELTQILDLLPDVKMTSLKNPRHIKVDADVLKQIISLSDDKSSKLSGGDIIAALAELVNANSAQSKGNLVIGKDTSSLQELIDANFPDIRKQRSKEIISILNDIVNTDGLEEFTNLPQNKELIGKIKSLLNDNPELVKELLSQTDSAHPGAKIGTSADSPKIENIEDYLPVIDKGSANAKTLSENKNDIKSLLNNGTSVKNNQPLTNETLIALNGYGQKTDDSNIQSNLQTGDVTSKSVSIQTGSSDVISGTQGNTISVGSILSATGGNIQITGDIINSQPQIKVSKQTEKINGKFSPTDGSGGILNADTPETTKIEVNATGKKDNFEQSFKNGQNGTGANGSNIDFLQSALNLSKNANGIAHSDTLNSADTLESDPQPSSQSVSVSKLPDKLIEAIKNLPDNTVYQAKMTLSPKSLGTIFVSINLKDNALKIDVRTDSVEAKHAIEGASTVLRDKLNDGGLKLDSFNVNVNRDFNSQDETANGQNDSQNRREALKYLKTLAAGSTQDNVKFADDLTNYNTQGSVLEKYL